MTAVHVGRATRLGPRLRPRPRLRLGLRPASSSAPRRPPVRSRASASRASGSYGTSLNLACGEDQLDHLALDDLVAQHVHLAALLQPGPDAARRLAALRGDQADLARRNPAGTSSIFSSSAIRSRMKCSLRARAVGPAAVLPQLVLVGPDLLVAETRCAAAPSPPAPARRWLCRLSKVGGQFPVGRLGQRGGDLLAGAAVLLVLQLPLEVVADRVAQVGLGLEAAQRRRGTPAVISGSSSCLTSWTSNVAVTVLAAEGLVRGVVAQSRLADAGLARPDARPSACRTSRSCRRGS